MGGLEAERDALKAHLENGTSDGVYPVLSGVLGWAHPYGVGYGGMTGGAEINLFDGVETAWAGEKAGYQKFRILHRMHTDRMNNVLFNLDGEPSSADDWVTSGPSGNYVPFNHFIVPYISGADAFGLHAACTSRGQSTARAVYPPIVANRYRKNDQTGASSDADDEPELSSGGLRYRSL